MSVVNDIVTELHNIKTSITTALKTKGVTSSGQWANLGKEIQNIYTGMRLKTLIINPTPDKQSVTVTYPPITIEPVTQSFISTVAIPDPTVKVTPQPGWVAGSCSVSKTSDSVTVTVEKAYVEETPVYTNQDENNAIIDGSNNFTSPYIDRTNLKHFGVYTFNTESEYIRDSFLGDHYEYHPVGTFLCRRYIDKRALVSSDLMIIINPTKKVRFTIKCGFDERGTIVKQYTIPKTQFVSGGTFTDKFTIDSPTTSFEVRPGRTAIYLYFDERTTKYGKKSDDVFIQSIAIQEVKEE